MARRLSTMVGRPTGEVADGFGAEADPLLEFSVEPAAVAAHVPETKRDDAALTPAAPAPNAADLVRRLERAERLFERSLIEIETLKSSVATLVNVVDDIEKRQSRTNATPPPPAPPVQKTSRVRSTVAAISLLPVALLGWVLASIVPDDLPQPRVLESERAAPVVAPAPAVEALPPPAEIQNAMRVSPVATAPPRQEAARTDPPPRAASRSPAGYVGTLTIDATPGGEVFLNRERVGRTPLRLEKIRAGSHLVWIEREGYRRWTRVVAVTADRVSNVAADLDPLSR